MRYLFIFFYCCALSVNAQTHFCAASKQHSALQSFGKSASLSQQELMNQYDAIYHHLNLTVQRDTTYIQGSVRTFARVIVSAFDTFGFELYNSLNIDSIVRNGSQLTYQRSTHFVYCVLPDTLHFNDVIDLTIYYHGTPPKAANAAIGAGFSSAASQRWGNRATWSLSQPYSAYEWWPCKQSLQDKLDSSAVSITTSSDNKAGSNGLLQRIDSLPGNLIRYNWASHYPIDYYLISVAVAKYKEYISYAVVNGDSILIQDYIYDNPATYTTFKPVLDQTASMITSFSEHLIPYPFSQEKYGHAMAPFSGGMEHQTMTSLGIIDFGIVAHELAHQWFGDYVTCKTWKDIWLNEGFASYMEYLALEWLDPGKKAAHMNDVHTAVLGNALGSIAFTDTTNVSRIFDSRLTYKKGAAFVHTLRYEINNDTLFFGFLRHYLQQFAHRTASTADFKQLLEQYTGRDFTQVFSQWFYGQGYPIFNMRWNQNGNKLFIRSTQTTAASATLLFKTPVDVLISTDQGDTMIRLYHDTLVEYETININGTVSALTVDPNNWILNASYTNRDPMMGLSSETSAHGGISLFPNPATNELHVVTDQEFRELTVRDMLGRDLIHSSTPSVVLDFLQSGAYICEVRSGPDNSINVVHFIKN